MPNGSQPTPIFTEGIVFSMMRDDLKGMKNMFERHIEEEREDFRRLADKIDDLAGDLRTEMKSYLVDITVIKTKMRTATVMTAFVATLGFNVAVLAMQSFF
jgi:ferritin-like protein